MLKEDIQSKIKEHHSKKKELDEIKRMFVKPKKSPVLAATLIILLLMICLPLTVFIVMNWLDAMTLEKTIYVDRTVIEQPIQKIYPKEVINNTIVVNKTVYKYPEKEADCTLVRIINNKIPTGEYFMHCEAVILKR